MPHAPAYANRPKLTTAQWIAIAIGVSLALAMAVGFIAWAQTPQGSSEICAWIEDLRESVVAVWQYLGGE